MSTNVKGNVSSSAWLVASKKARLSLHTFAKLQFWIFVQPFQSPTFGKNIFDYEWKHPIPFISLEFIFSLQIQLPLTNFFSRLLGVLHCCFYYLFGPIPEYSNEDFFQLYIFSFMFSEEILKKLQIPVYIPAVLAMMSDPFSRKLSTSFIHQQYLTSPKNYLVNLRTLKRKNLKTHIMTRINANHSVKFKALTSIFFIRTLQHPYTRKHVTFTENWYYNLQREFLFLHSHHHCSRHLKPLPFFDIQKHTHDTTVMNICLGCG